MSIKTALGSLALALTLGLTLCAPCQAEDEAPPAPVSGVKEWLNVPEGEQGPAWDQDRSGDVDFAALDGKVVVVEFWATWCPPCVRSIPHLNALFEAHADEGLVILGLTSLDRRQTEDQVRSYTSEKIKYPVGMLSVPDTLRAYGVRGIPHAVVVGRDGKVRWTGNPLSPQFEGAVKAALAATGA